MGHDISKAVHPHPLTLTHCFVDGQFHYGRYYIYKGKCQEHEKKVLMSRRNRRRKRHYSSDNLLAKKIPRNKHRSVKRYKLEVRDTNGSLREIRPEDTLWYMLYVRNSPLNERMSQQFRYRFRIPYESFLSLYDDITNHPCFAQWSRSDAVGDKPANIKLLLLGCMRYIGRAWTFDDIYEANGISISTNRHFMMCFMEYGSSVLYKKWVIDATLNRDIAVQESVFRNAGFNGCIGSSDGTHIPMLKCAQWACNNHKGFKLNVPARTYNVTVDHSRRILASTTGHPGTWNDKTLILFDEFITGVHTGSIHKDFIFHLKEKDADGKVVDVAYRGVWFIVDNGYLSWSCTVPPSGNGTTYEIIRFSEWLESIRKDVECTFGIMKGRFAILRYGLRFQSIVKCDQMWLTCCALHNLLLDYDGLDSNWDNGNNMNGIEMPFAITRLNQPTSHPVDSNSNDGIVPEKLLSTLCKKYTRNNYRIVKDMPLELFKKCLVNHFDIRFKKNDIVWPVRKDS